MKPDFQLKPFHFERLCSRELQGVDHRIFHAFMSDPLHSDVASICRVSGVGEYGRIYKAFSRFVRAGILIRPARTKRGPAANSFPDWRLTSE